MVSRLLGIGSIALYAMIRILVRHAMPRFVHSLTMQRGRRIIASNVTRARRRIQVARSVMKVVWTPIRIRIRPHGRTTIAETVIRGHRSRNNAIRVMEAVFWITIRRTGGPRTVDSAMMGRSVEFPARPVTKAIYWIIIPIRIRRIMKIRIAPAAMRIVI